MKWEKKQERASAADLIKQKKRISEIEDRNFENIQSENKEKE